MEIKSRGLNKDECFVCSPKDIKCIFSSDDNIFINFGYLHRNHNFDSAFIKRQKIKGSIVSSLSINRRMKVIDSRPILSFYVMKDSGYSDTHKKIFLETILPEIHQWYYKTLSKSEVSIPGVEELLVEWTGDNFKIHNCRFA